MMLTDKQRREVAERMRSKKPEEFGQPIAQSVFRHVFRSLYPKQIYPVSNWVLRMPYVLADLIDRPTCQNKQIFYNRTTPKEFRTDNFTCSTCGETFCADGDGVNHQIDWAFCPNCGAEVAE